MARDRDRDIQQAQRKIFFNEDTNSPMAEAFRGLRTNLYFMNEREECHVVVFTSSVPKEGKTTVAANYAMSTAVNGKRTLIIDCDIKRPRIDNAFDIEARGGLLAHLRGEKELAECIVRERYRNLDILPTKGSTEYTTEMFHSQKFAGVVEELKKNYDQIVIDTAPVGVAGEAGIISKHAHGVVVVCGYDMINKKQLMHTKKHLENAGANIYGAVVNRIDRSGYAYGSYSYYTDYYKYYNEYQQG
ncbi:tyrosine protein kinase [Propionigenium maris DSM 9537]|uniref:non-specific protein-tyrosine kinase n=1 Tax=Propionigenium maris DSM 9537 TaxID=1123000 RepID=A0A9W6GKQ3_9FUSO|nr:CpsD/CapB family tyrosine-protein kinase [Propionigenium maris]GLI56903.1 tyrosine protein kinase [Propionigenium maris DSM 9537]